MRKSLRTLWIVSAICGFACWAIPQVIHAQVHQPNPNVHDPTSPPPAGAVAWRVENTDIAHVDGPFALPGAPNPQGFSVVDPAIQNWADVDLCPYIHLHGPFSGHGDPAPGPPTTASACGHGGLIYLAAGGSVIPPATPPSAAKKGKTFVIPHLLEKTGRVDSTTFTFDTTIFATYACGLLDPSKAAKCKGAQVDLYLFDNSAGQPLQSATGQNVCNPCSFSVDTTTRKRTIVVDDLITAEGGFPSQTVLGFGVIVVSGDTKNVNMQGFVTNSHTGPFDLSVFGFEPQPLGVPAQ